jgi:hypothetical protein
VFASLRGVFLVFVEADLASCGDVNMFKTEQMRRFEKWDWVESRRRERKVPFDG